MNRNVRLVVYLVITMLISAALFNANKEALGVLNFLGGVFLSVRTYLAEKKLDENNDVDV